MQRDKSLEEQIIFSLFDEISSKKNLSMSAYKYVLETENFEEVVTTVLKILKKTTPKRANIEQAAKVADQMQAFARHKLKELEEK